MATVRRWALAGGHRDVWLFAVTALVIVALEGFGPFGIKGIDDVARDANHAAHEAQQATRDNATARHALARQVEAQRLTERDVARIARHQARLESPTTSDLLRLIQRATTLCASRPAACAPRPRSSSSNSPNVTPVPTAPRRAPSRRRRRADRGTPPPPRKPSKPPPAERPPPSSPSTVTVTTPGHLLRPGVCVDGLIRVDCP